MKVTFADLGVPASLVGALHRAGIAEPFPIQTATLPDGIAGRDVLARAQTGSGKTLAFGLAMLTRLIGRPTSPGQPYGLILVPTRELAMQVSDGLAPLADAAGMRIRLIAGGMPYPKQIEAIARGVHILVATPGRLMDLVNRGSVDLSEVSITVLDEADQMADMGFLPQVRELLDLTRPKGQRLLFSATLDGEVDTIVKAYMSKPARHELAPVHAPVETMDHHLLLVHPMDKEEVAARIAARDGRTIMFVRTQAGVDRLTDYLRAQGVPAGGLHGGKSQAERNRTLTAFKEGTTRALVATDVAARGIHVDGISLVVNVDAPTGPKDYLHRAGRTARAGESGTVVMLAAPRQQRTASSLLGRAGVSAKATRIRPVDQELVDITGAQEPSGIAWTPPRVKASPARRHGGQRAPRATRESTPQPDRKLDEHRSRPPRARADRPRRDDERGSDMRRNTDDRRSTDTRRGAESTSRRRSDDRPVAPNREERRKGLQRKGKPRSDERSPRTGRGSTPAGPPQRGKKPRHKKGARPTR